MKDPDLKAMQRSTGKMGRGGGSASNRSIHIHTTPVNDRAASTARLSMGGGPRGRAGASSASISAPPLSSLQVEESFSLVRENRLNYGMAIKLAPDLVEEIRRVEALGGSTSIKFDANANNPNGNVIRVGDKSFRFTWSKEPEDLCDIYEECGNGEDGNGLLVESGGTWRKLNVERELDESTKNHVKRRSEEAEQKLKSRRAIVLDPQIPSMKNQMKAIAAVESNPWKNFKSRKETPSKKPKFEPHGGGLPSLSKSTFSATAFVKGNFSSGSPLSSHHEQHGPLASAAGSDLLLRGYSDAPEVQFTQSMSKTATASSGRETNNRLLTDNAHEKSDHNRIVKPSDLCGLMMSLLLEHHDRGMHVKDLERATGDAFPDSAWQMESILKQIAVCRTNGKYFLKPGVEMETLNKMPSQSQSAPEINHHQGPEPRKSGKLSSPDPKGAVISTEEKDVSPVYTDEDVEKIDILSISPEHSNEKKPSNNGEGTGGNSDTGSGSENESDSSESDSDTDSDSDDSGSDSGSRSRSKSISQRSCSASSTDNRSDASSSSKQASDEDVDIVTRDDDKESSLHKLYDSGVVSLKSPVDIGGYGRNDAFVSSAIRIVKGSPHEGDYAERQADLFHSEEGEEAFEQMKYSGDHYAQDEGKMWGKNCPKDRELELDTSYDQPDAPHQSSSMGECKRQFDYMHVEEEKTGNRKRFNSKNSSHPVSGTLNSIFGDSPYNSSPDSPIESPERGTTNLTTNGTMQNGRIVQPVFSYEIPNTLMSENVHAERRSSEAFESTNDPYGRKKPEKSEAWDLASKNSEKNMQSGEVLAVHKSLVTDASSEDCFTKEKNLTQFLSDRRDKQLALPAKTKMTGSHTCTHPVNSPENIHSIRSPVIDGQRRVLRRELSDLESGELRETTYYDVPVDKEQFQRESPLKQMKKNAVDCGSWNSDMSRRKPYSKSKRDVGKISPQNQETIPQSKRKATEHYTDRIKPLDKVSDPPHQQHQYLGENAEVGSQLVNAPEMSSKSRPSEMGIEFRPSGTVLGEYGRKRSVNSIGQHHDTNGSQVKEKKRQKMLDIGESKGRQKTGINGGGGKWKETLDEITCLYIKYEKAEPELKGPIKDASQYVNYVEEYQVKYESYVSLYKILVPYSNEFVNFDAELGANKGQNAKRRRDRVLEQVVSLYRQCGESFKRLKKIFGLLHVELEHMKEMIKEFAASYGKQ